MAYTFGTEVCCSKLLRRGYLESYVFQVSASRSEYPSCSWASREIVLGCEHTSLSSWLIWCCARSWNDMVAVVGEIQGVYLIEDVKAEGRLLLELV